MSQIDIVLIHPGEKKLLYQDLDDDLTAVEPPFRAGMAATYLRNRGYRVVIIDAAAENLAPEEITARVRAGNPLLAVVMVFGSHPSASTQNMTSANRICRMLKSDAGIKTALFGPHPSALPEATLREISVDWVIQGEDLTLLDTLLQHLKSSSPPHAKPAIWSNDNAISISGATDIGELPPVAWDLLPMGKYKAHNWHCLGDLQSRHPYAVICTSIGCPFKCRFCAVHRLGGPGARMHFRDPKDVIDEIDLLVHQYQMRNIKIADELFILNPDHYLPIVDALIERDYDLNIWAYARVDTIRPDTLPRLKKAGIQWIALGIESGSESVLADVAKKTNLDKIREAVNMLRDNGIFIMGNYIFGLPGDNMETMQATYDLAVELNCEFVNFYCCMAYPGSDLYREALENRVPLPENWHGYSQHAYETMPLPTQHLTAAEVLSFRDNAFINYFRNPDYLNGIEKKFGIMARRHIERMTGTRLKRKLLGD